MYLMLGFYCERNSVPAAVHLLVLSSRCILVKLASLNELTVQGRLWQKTAVIVADEYRSLVSGWIPFKTHVSTCWNLIPLLLESCIWVGWLTGNGGIVLLPACLVGN
jgi:hypothetical protein